METIGDFEYPAMGTFKQALFLTETANETYGGIIPIPNAVRALGYNIKDESSISGQIYKRINDLTHFGLFVRDRGVLRVTELGKRAIQSMDKGMQEQSLAMATRNIPIISKAFDEWKGEIPDKTAFPARIATITKENYKDCEKHTVKLQKLFNETFPYLKLSNELLPTTGDSKDSGVISISNEQALVPQKNSPVRGELRTSIGSVVITNKSQVKLARNLLDVFEEELESKLENQSNSTDGGEED